MCGGPPALPVAASISDLLIGRRVMTGPIEFLWTLGGRAELDLMPLAELGTERDWKRWRGCGWLGGGGWEYTGTLLYM